MAAKPPIYVPPGNDVDRRVLKQLGVTAVLTRKDYQLTQIMSEIGDLVDGA